MKQTTFNALTRVHDLNLNSATWRVTTFNSPEDIKQFYPALDPDDVELRDIRRIIFPATVLLVYTQDLISWLDYPADGLLTVPHPLRGTFAVLMWQFD